MDNAIKSSQTGNYVKYLVSLLIFATNGIVAGFIPLGSMQIVFARTAIGTVFMALVMLLRRTPIRFGEYRRQLLPLAVSGVTMGLSWACQFAAYRIIGVSRATLFYYCGPVLVMALSPLLFSEKLTAPKIFGIIAVIGGMLLMNGTGGSGSLRGYLLGAASAVCYAAMIVSSKKVKNLSGLEITLAQLVIGGITLCPFALAGAESAVRMDPVGVMALAVLGIVNTGLACLLYFSSMHHLPAQSVAILSYLDPLGAVLFSSVVFRAITGDSLRPAQALGVVLILGGAAAGELIHPKRKTA